MKNKRTTYDQKSVQYAEYRADLCRLKFERAAELGSDGVHDMTIACAQEDYWRKEAMHRRATT